MHPAGPAAEAIASLWWVLLAGSVAIFLLTMALLAVGFRRNPAASLEGRAGRLWLGGLGIAFPLAVLGALLVYGLVIGERLMPRDVPGLVTVSAEARQWEWRFGYADAPGRVTENVLHIPAGRPVDVRITSTDVVHSFWVPRLAGKMDVVPGKVNRHLLQADTPGRYAGQCAEYCGVGHDAMRFEVIVRAAEPQP